MSSFDDYRKKLQNKYGTPEKASEKEDEKTKKATTGSSFSEYRSKLTEKYASKATSSDLENWLTDADATLRAMQEYHTQNDGKYTPQYGGEMSQKIKDLMYSSGDIYSYLQNHKSEIGNYDEVSRAFAEYRNVLQQNQIYNYNKSRYYSQFESEDAYNKWYEDNKKVEEYKSVLDAEDFEKYSYLGKRVKNPDWKDAHAPFEILGWTPFGDGDDIGNMVTFAEANGANAFKAAASSMIGGGRASEYQEIVNLINAYMEDDEKKIYNYYVGKGDTEKANEYLAYITDILRQRQGGVIAAKGNDKPAELAVSFFAGAQGGFQGIENFVKGVAGTEGTDISSLQYASDEMRQDNTGLWMAMNDVASSAGNMTPAIIAGGVATAVAGPGVGQAVGATVTGISSAGSSYADMIREGYGVDQARKYGVMVGAAEGGLSYLFSGISKLGGKVTGNVVNKVIDGVDSGIARFFTEFAINSGSEALEEGAQAILDPIFKKLATGEDFEGIDWSEVAYSSLLGALSAGMLEGVPNAAGSIHSNYKANVAHGGLSNMGAIKALADTKSIKGVAAAYKEGKQAVTESGKAYVNEALEIAPENAYAQRMQAKLNDGKNISGSQINRLFETTENTLVNQDKTKMKSAVEARLTELGETGDISKLADVIVKARTDGNLTRSERSMLTDSKYGRRVSTEMNPTSIESGEYSSDWAEKIGTKRINTEAYNKGLYDLAEEVAGVTADENIPSATNNTPAKEIATESEFKASEDGKTRIGDMEVSVKEIASVKDGKVVLRLDDDSTVDARDVDFGSTAEVQLYENVAHMGWTPDVANSFVKGYDGSMPVNNYAQGFSEAYRFGTLGIPMVDVTNGVFSSGLPEATRNLAYGYGKADAKVKVESKQAKIASVGAKKAGNNASLGKKKGGLHNTLKPTNETQRASLKILGVLADTLGIDIYTFESEEVNGRRQGANGWYDPTDNSIHIDLFAGSDGKGTMLFTAAHELTHHIREKLPAKFKAFADFLFEQYAEKGISVSERIEAKIKDLEANGRTKGKTEAEIYDLAYEEVVADSCESFLADGNAVAKIAELKAKDKSLWQTIKDFINKLVARIKAAYEGLSPDSVEGRYVAEMLDNAEKLKAMWAEMVVEASEVETTTELLGKNGILVDAKTNSATLYSVRDVLSDADRKKVSKSLAERFDVTQSEAMDWLKAETSLASLILNPKYSQYLDYTADPNEEAIKSNSDYPQGTVDFSNICKKRRDFTEVMNRVLRNFPHHVFAATDLAKIRTIMEQEGMEVACAICYVEDRRQLDSVVAQNFIDSLALYRKGSKTKPDGTPFNANQLKAFSLIEGDTYTPSIYELISLEGRNSLKAKNPAMEEAWVKFNNARGMQSVRLLLNDAEYKRQILKYSQSVVKRKNDLGGLRIYSFSDMEMFHLIDIIQVITDSAAVGLSLQGYTKVNEYAKAVKDTGEKLNRSLIPKGDLGYHMEDGKVVLDFDTTEGIDINHPDFFDNIDNPNIGNIVIGINATQIKAAMTSKFIDQIIPFHTGQSNEVLGEKGIAAWDNYKDFQSERDVKTNKKSSHQINIYTEVINAAESEGKPITNKVDFVNKFLEVCRENNLIPRFSDFLNVDENGNYVYTEGYHKFLVDFKTFDQNTGEYLPQMPVKPVFDNAYITSLLTDYVKSQKAKDTEFTKAMPKVLDRITKEIVSPVGDVKYSDRNFASQVDAVLNGADTSSTHLKLMDTPSLLQEAGLPNLPVLMTANHLKKITATTGHGLDVEMVKKLPEYISSPVMIADSLTRDDSVVIITEAIDSENRPVIAAIMLSGTGQLDNKYVDANIMTSAYGRNNFQSFLDRIADSNSVIYWDKEKSQDLSVNLGVQFPNVITSLDSGVIIHQAKAFVNAQNEKNLNSDRPAESVSNRSLLTNALESAVKEGEERNLLRNYKTNLRLLEAEQAKLNKVEADIGEIKYKKSLSIGEDKMSVSTFERKAKEKARKQGLDSDKIQFKLDRSNAKYMAYIKGVGTILEANKTFRSKEDMDKLQELYKKSKEIATRINSYDRELLKLEAMQPIKDVLNREKKLAYKRAEQKGKEALAAYREKATKTQRELLTRYQESRKKGIEGRKQTAMRLKVKNIVNELNQYLLKGTKEKHVPIELQGVVAEALAVVNMDTVGAEERLASIHKQLAKDPLNPELLMRYKRIAEQGERMDEKLQALKNAYDEIVNSDDPLIANSHDEVISNSIAKVIKDVGNTPLRDMSLSQLEEVYDMYRMVLSSIRKANKAFKAAKGEEISTIANGVISELMDQKRKIPYSSKAQQTMSEFDWNNLKPVYAFERIGSANFTTVFDAVREGEDVWAKDMSEAQAFREEQFQKYKYDSWDFGKRFGFTSTSGMKFELSLDQIMSLYAFSKRDQAEDHLKYGGFVFDGLTEVKAKNKVGITVTYQLKDATAYNLSEETLAEIIGTLTPEQKAFVDVMQDYLSTVMGEKGNEVSLALYDIKLFKEKYYFPLKSAPQYLAKAKEQAMGEVKIKNSGFTKETTPKAKNPIVLSSFMDVWAGHVNDMSMYHSFTLPLEDFYRVYNYHTPADKKFEMVSVGASLENAHGQAAVNYIDQLLKDLNGGARSDPRDSIGKALMANFKKASVMVSWSVVIQQPSAIIRAQALVDAKYFVGTPSGKHKDNWAEVKKYAPVAIIKEMGYFDTGMGKSSVEWLKGEKTLMDKIDDATSKLPALADEVTWVSIWNAVKRETLHTHKNLRPNSEEFLKAVGERFTEVIVKTQVYDSTLSRSANMRSKSTWMNMVTSFLAEPTTSINMLQDSFRKGKRGKYTLRVMGAVYGSVLLNSALVSIVYAMRDDDEDETFLEKYLSRFTTEMVDGVNPLTYIPLVKDVWSLLQGYDIERADMSLISDVVASLQQMVKLVAKDTSDMDEDEIAEHKKAITESVLKITDSLSSFTGIPVKNVRRDLNGFINAYKTIKKDATERDTTAGSLGDNILEDVKDSVPVWGWFPDESKGDKLYDAIVKGDTAYVDRLKGGYKTDTAYQSAERKALRENDPRIKEAAEARYAGRNDEYMQIVRSIKAEGKFTQDTIVAAINAEISKLKPDKESSVSSPDFVTVDDYYSSIVNGDTGTARTIFDMLVKEKLADGYLQAEAEDLVASSFSTKVKGAYMDKLLTRSKAKSLLVSHGNKSDSEAEVEIKKCDFELKHDIAWSERARAYRLGKISERALVSAVVDIEGATQAEAEEYIRFLDLEMDYPTLEISATDASKYFEFAEPAKIGIEVYLDYKDRTSGLTSDKDEKGNAISGSKKKKVMAVIDSLPLTSAQKDALYYANGLAASTIREAPWH